MNKVILKILILLLMICALSGCNKLSEAATPMLNKTALTTANTMPTATGTIYATYIHNSVERSYILYIPKNLPEDAPLVIGLHGYTSSPETFKNNFGWDKVAEENKFLMCYPQGTISPYTNYSHWNARLTLSTVDDVGFLSDLALYLADEYNLNNDKLFVTGFSNGGFMSYTLGCERPDVFRAIAPVAGLMSEYTYNSYNPQSLTAKNWLQYQPATPVPVCHIHGSADTVVPIKGMPKDSAAYGLWGGGPSALETVKFWAGINECTPAETQKLTETATCTYYRNGTNGNEVWYVTINGWSHYWPAKDYKVDKKSQIDAQEIIWEFFSMY